MQGCDDSTLAELRRLAAHPRCVAVGECGLDFNRNFSPPEAQERWFAAQIELAEELGLPLFMHCRDAGERFAHIYRRAAWQAGLGWVAGWVGGCWGLAGWYVTFNNCITSCCIALHAMPSGQLPLCHPAHPHATCHCPSPPARLLLLLLQAALAQRARRGALLHRQPGGAGVISRAGAAHRHHWVGVR